MLKRTHKTARTGSPVTWAEVLAHYVGKFSLTMSLNCKSNFDIDFKHLVTSLVRLSENCLNILPVHILHVQVIFRTKIKTGILISIFYYPIKI